jgi:hypothetical protein
MRTRELFCVGNRKRRKRHSKDGEVARQRKLFSKHFLLFSREREGKKSYRIEAAQVRKLMGIHHCSTDLTF